MLETKATLLRDMKQLGGEAWEAFFRQYACCILRYARARGLQDQDAEDVLQETMVALMRKIKSFDYDPTRGLFRNFLLGLVHSSCMNSKRRAGRRGEVLTPGNKMPETPVDLPPWEVLEDCWKESIRAEAFARVMNDPSVAKRTMEIFRAYAVDRQSAAVIANRFGVKENAVYQIRNRVMQRLKKEIEFLSDGIMEARG
jgi:RNA polymerase sigma factor (sigma-70 family)